MTRPNGHTLLWLSSRQPDNSDIHTVDSSSSSAVKHTLVAVLILLSGAALGGGAARIAESTVTSRVTTDAADLDRLSSLAESAALMQASINQALLLAGTERPAALARAEAESAVAVFETSLMPVRDDVLLESGQQMLDAATQALSELDSGRPIAEIGAMTPALEVSYRSFADLVSERRRSARTSIAATAADEATATVALTALVVFLAPALVVFITVHWVRKRVSRPVPTRLPRDAQDPAAPHPAMALSPAGQHRATSVVGPRGELVVVDASAFGAGAADLMPGALVPGSVAHNLVTLDRVRTGTMTITTKPTDLGTMVQLVAERAGQLGIHIDVIGDPVHGMADAPRLQDALMNLLAVCRAEGADRMALVLGLDNGSATITVAGTGFSMSTELISNLRDERVVDTSNASGLSLSVAGHLTRAMGGQVRYHEESGMTLLILDLPLADRVAG